MQNAFISASERFPYKEEEHLEVKPGVRVPTDNWEGYEFMCTIFYDESTPETMQRMRRVLAVHNHVRLESAEGKTIDWEQVEDKLRDMLFGEPAAENVDVRKAIIFEIKKSARGKTMEYMVQQSDGEDKVYTRYELKRKYPDRWKQMVRQCQEITKNIPNSRIRQDVESSSPYSSDIEAEYCKDERAEEGVHALHRRDEELHQGSTMMGSTDEKRLRARGLERMEIEGHGEGGSTKFEKLMQPRPAAVYSGHVGTFKKRLSEPPVPTKNRAMMYSPQIGTVRRNPDLLMKRGRLSLDADATPGPQEYPYIATARTDTASVAMQLLSRIMENENRLCDALDEQKARGDLLEKMLAIEADKDDPVHMDGVQKIPQRDVELAKTIEQRDEEITRLKSSMRLSKSEKDSAVAKFELCQEELSQAKENLSALTKQNSKMIGDLTSMKQKLKEKMDQISDLQKKISEDKKLFQQKLAQSEETQKQEIKSMADTLAKERANINSQLARMAQDTSSKELKKLLSQKEGLEHTISSLQKENNSLEEKLKALSDHDTNATTFIEQALLMQQEARNALDILKRGDSLEIATYYESLDDADDGTAGPQEKDTVKRWLRPGYWKYCKIVGARKRNGSLQYKAMNTRTRAVTYIDSSELQKRQFCLLQMLKYIEARAESSIAGS